MSHKYICSCGSPQFRGESLTIPRSENKGGLNHQFEETFNVWICDFCGEKKYLLTKAFRQSKGSNLPRRYIIDQYAPALVKIPKKHKYIRAKTFINILEGNFPDRDSDEILENMLFEGIIQIDYTMKNANRDSFIPMRLRFNPDFENDIREALDEYKGIESIDEKITRIKQILLHVGEIQITNPQTEKILSILKIQQKFLSNEEIPYFNCGSKKCLIRNGNDRYETLLKILNGLLENVSHEGVILSSDFCASLNLNGTCLSEYRSDLEAILNSKLVFFGILKNVEPLYIPPSKIPMEISAEIELFETNLRSFIKINLLNYYGSIDDVFNKALKSIFHKNAFGGIQRKMIKDLKSDYDKTKDYNLKIAINIVSTSQPNNLFIFDRFFEAMVMGNLIEIIKFEWDAIFLNPFDYFHKTDILEKLSIIKEDRNIKSHSKSRIPTTFKTLTCIYEFNHFL